MNTYSAIDKNKFHNTNRVTEIYKGCGSPEARTTETPTDGGYVLTASDGSKAKRACCVESTTLSTDT